MSTPNSDPHAEARRTFRNALYRLNDRWEIFEALFTSEENLAAFNGAAPSFFRELEEVLLDSLTIDISRLTDMPVQGKKQNLTLGALLLDPKLAPVNGTAIAKLQAIEQELKDLRVWRNQRVAHWDRDVATGAKVLPTVKYETFKRVIRTIGDIVNDLERHVAGWEFGMLTYKKDGGVQKFLKVLKAGVEAYAADIASRKAAHLKTLQDLSGESPAS